MYAAELRRAAEAAPRVKLPEIVALLWRAYGAGQVSEIEAEELSTLIEARTALPLPVVTPRKLVGSRPRTDASMERRRRWAASGRLPPAIAARFTLAEQAVLALVAAEIVKRGDCRLAIGHIAAAAGVSETTVRNAMREARRLNLITIEERRVARFRNATNIVRVVSIEWTAWLRLAKGRGLLPTPQPRGGCKSARGTSTDSSRPVNSRQWNQARGYRGIEIDPSRSVPTGYRADDAGLTRRLMPRLVEPKIQSAFYTARYSPCLQNALLAIAAEECMDLEILEVSGYKQIPPYDATETTVSIVSAYVAKNRLQAAQLPALISGVYDALTSLAKTSASEALTEKPITRPTPAQIKRSVTPDAIISFVDGKSYKTMKRHLTRHGLTPQTYRERYGLPEDYPMMAQSYTKRRSDIAKSIGLGRFGGMSRNKTATDNPPDGV